MSRADCKHSGRLKATAPALCAALWAVAPAAPVQAYPIDCAILLCMAGGFPPEPECIAAKAEVTRRITPWPVEPPLQLWRCPMDISQEAAALAGIAAPQVGPDGLTSEVRGYRDAMQIYHVQYRRTGGGKGSEPSSHDMTTVGRYAADGSFSWGRGSFENGPAWLAKAVGGRRETVRECVNWHREGGCNREITRTENRGTGPLTRGVVFRYEDHTGAIHDQFVRY